MAFAVLSSNLQTPNVGKYGRAGILRSGTDTALRRIRGRGLSYARPPSRRHAESLDRNWCGVSRRDRPDGYPFATPQNALANAALTRATLLQQSVVQRRVIAAITTTAMILRLAIAVAQNIIALRF